MQSLPLCEGACQQKLNTSFLASPRFCCICKCCLSYLTASVLPKIGLPAGRLVVCAILPRWFQQIAAVPCCLLAFQSFHIMSAINIASVNVLDNPTLFQNPLQLEIQYECLYPLQHGEGLKQLTASTHLQIAWRLMLPRLQTLNGSSFTLDHQSLRSMIKCWTVCLLDLWHLAAIALSFR